MDAEARVVPPKPSEAATLSRCRPRRRRRAETRGPASVDRYLHPGNLNETTRVRHVPITTVSGARYSVV